MKITKNKQGLEMSVGMIVTIIISLIVFVTSIYLFYNMVSKTKIIGEALSQLEEDKIKELILAENRVIAIPFSTKPAKKGNYVNFGIGVRNIDKEVKSFGGIISFVNGFEDSERQKIILTDKKYVEENWLENFKTLTPRQIKPADFDNLISLIKVDSNTAQNKPTQKAYYLFYLCIYDKDKFTKDNIDAAKTECTTDNVNLFYTRTIYPLTVHVN